MVHVKALKSHPTKLLKSHVLGVVKRALNFFNDYKVRTAALFHDVGKTTQNFQNKLAGNNVEGLYTNHAYLSFLCLLNYVAHCGLKTGIVANKQDLIIIGICILKHHGGLPNLREIINTEEWDRMKDFLNTNQAVPADEFLSHVKLEKTKVQFPFQDITKARVMSLFDTVSLRGAIPDPLQFFFDLRMCFSALVAGDKGDAGNHKLTDEMTKTIRQVYSQRIQTYLSTLKPTTALNRVRTEIRETSLENLKRAMAENPNQHVFSLTEPTGSGKTAALLTLADAILKKKEGVKKVIYSIPFLSITEQIFDIVERIFNKERGCIKRIDCKAQPDLDAADIHDDFGEEDLLRKIKSILLKAFKGKTPRIEAVENILRADYQESTFDYPLIVTTFVQFFQSFTTATNKGLMRFSSLRNSVFLIDEIQAMPPRLYAFFVALLDEFCKKYNSYAIVSTATMPSFEIPTVSTSGREMFKSYTPPIEIGSREHFNYDVFNRYELHIIKTPIKLGALVSMLLSEQEATLVILNTVKDSQRVYNQIKSQATCPVILMNSNFHSQDRRTILSRCQEFLKNGQKFYMITTQLVEAGVDIDFPRLYRDIAPIPNIVQSAGRCNREGKRNCRGIVTIFQLEDEEGKKLRASYIYNGLDRLFLNYAIDKLVLCDQEIFQERELYDIQKGYFEHVSQSLEFASWVKGDDHLNFIQQIKDFKYKEIGMYTVIPDKQYGVQERFYVPESEEDDSYERLLELLSEKNDIEELGSKAGSDSLREIIFKGTQIHSHLKKMMDRVVQVNIAETKITNLIVYEAQACYMYKLKPGLYNSEYGLSL
jgi:CRISPR-associated endonuclease/helicase Cas3